MTVDSKPILDVPPSNINLIFFPNSSITSLVFTGLILLETFALGIARGNFNFFNKFLIILFLGNLTAIVFNLQFAKFDIFDSFFFFST